MVPVPDQESAGKPRSTNISSGKSRYNGPRIPPDEPGDHEREGGRERSRRAGDVTVVVPDRPPVIDPQTGRALLRVLLKAAQDQDANGDLTKRKAA